MVVVIMVWPWWLRNRVITSRRPVASCAILTAPSLAVEPPDTLRCTLVRFGGVTSTSLRTNSLTGAVWKVEVVCTSRSAWSRMALTTSGCP